MGKKPWSDDEVDYLTNNYSKLTNADIAKHLSRTTQSVKRKAHKMQLQLTREPLKKGYECDRLTVLGPAPAARDGRQLVSMVTVECRCGSGPFEVKETIVRNRRLSSCGCLQKEIVAKAIGDASRTHGKSTTKLYLVWRGMHSRCENKNVAGYANYGLRGIYVCDEWAEFEPFAEWAEKNGYEEGLQIDRKENDGPYSPDNCRFVTRINNCNNKSDNHRVAAFGEIKTLAEWSRDPRCQVGYHVLRDRILRPNWTPEDAISRPRRKRVYRYSSSTKSP